MRERVASVTLVALVAYSAIATDLYLPAIPDMAAEFGTDAGAGQFTLSIFMIGIAVGQLLFGPLSDYFGRLPVATAGTVLFLVTSIACGLAQSIEMMWLSRGLQGFSAASGLVIARAIVHDRYHGNRAAQVMSTLGAAMALVPLVAPIIGSWLLVFVGWRATFGALAVFAVLVLLGLRTFDETAPAIGQGPFGLKSVLRQFAACLRNRQFIGYQLCGAASFSAIFAYLSTVSFIMYDVFAVQPINFGYAFLITVGGFMSGSLLSSRVVIRLGLDRTLSMGCILALIAALFQFWFALQTPVSALVMVITTFSIFLGIGLTFANASMGAVALFPRNAGAASAVYGFIHALSASAAGYLAGAAYDGTVVPTAAAILIGTAIAGIGLLLVRSSTNTDTSAAITG
ncbi:permease, major facilitator superfamily [Luminiphilus syltensis NOR5-1B]|uniref:Bcr/CflA family efflux transporter n=1 Tax=Luminiphilus syltensis NOR5-1B TaxID=565045 RepID=B8KSB7_9GAMM|nr:multidrug effflux MFS transporter [Luminiphilus syltensis]EED35712.1 permease, major facilitator superfamily [Luminiphilus syltensis NOR5-1B]